MAVGIGAGVNLGAFTAFLFIDGTGLQRGLLQADKLMSQFLARQQATAEALNRLQFATIASKQAQTLAAAVNAAPFRTFERQITQATTQATAEVIAQYRRRREALIFYRTALAGLRSDEKRTEAQIRQIDKQIPKLQAAIKKLERDTPEIAIGDAGRAKWMQNVNQIRLMEEQIRNLRTFRGQLAQGLRGIQTAMAELQRQTGAVVSDSARKQETALVKVRTELGRQLNAYMQLAQQAGPAYENLARRVQESGKRVIDASQRLAKARADVFRATQIRQDIATGAIRPGISIEAAVRAEEAALRRQQAAMSQFRAARRAFEADERRFVTAITQLAKKRADEELKAAKQAQRAMEQEIAAAKLLRDQRLGAAFNAIQVAAFSAAAATTSFTKTFFDLNTELTKSAAIDEEIAANFEKVQKRVEQLAITFGKAPAEIAAGLNTIVQADIKGEEAFRLLEVAVKASVAGFTDVQAAVKPLIGVINAYGASTAEAARFADILFQGVTAGIFTFEELSKQLGDNLSLASTLNVSLEELAAAYIVLTKRSNSLAESTTQVNAIMNAFLKGNTALNEVVKERTGLLPAEFIAQKGLAATLELTAQIIEDLGEETAGQLIPNIRALRGIMGLTSRSAEDFGRELRKVIEAEQSGGRMSAVLARTMQSAVFPLRQAQASFQVMAANLAQSFAPGLALAARGAALLTQGITALNSITRGAVGIFLGVTASTLVAGAAFLRLASSAKSIALGLVEAVKWLKEVRAAAIVTSKAMLILRAAMSPVGIAAIALTAIAGTLFLAHQRQKKAAEELAQAYKNLDRTISVLGKRPDITVQEAENLKLARDQLVQTIEVLKRLKAERERAFGRGQTLREREQLITVAFDEQGNAIEQAAVKTDKLAQKIDELLDASEEKRLIEAFDKITSTTNLNVDAFLQKFNDLLAQLRAGKITADQFVASIEDMAAHTEELTREFQEQENAVVKAGRSMASIQEFFGTGTTQRLEALSQALQSAAQQILVTAGALPDLSSPLAFIQSQIGGVGSTAVQTVARLAELGKIDLSTAERQALRLASKIDTLKNKIDESRQALRDHETAINDWEGLMQTVADTVGTQSNNYRQLAELAKRFQLTQEEVNRIQEAANFLNERAKIGIEEERLAMARSLPDLAAFVAAHDKAVKRYEELDPAARGAADAIRDAKNQAALMAVIMLKLANALAPEAFPQEVVTTFIADISRADPVIAALLDRYSLVPEELRSRVIVDTDLESLKTVKEVDEAIASTRAQIDALLKIPQTPETIQQIEALKTRLRELQERRTDIKIRLEVNPNEIPKIESGIPDAVNTVEDEVAELKRAWTEAFDRMREDPVKVSRALAEAIPQLIEQAKLVDDFSDPLAHLTRDFDEGRKSIENVILSFQRLSGSKLTLSGAQKEALRLSARLKEVEFQLDRLDGSIQQNMDDMSMWQNRIQLVDDTVGTAEDGYDKLNQLLQTGRITQEEYNRILAAAVWLRERSVGGVLDERAEIAKSLPDLAAYVQLHDHLDGAYKKLTPEQRGFVAALQDQNVQLLLSTALMIAQLEALGQAAPGATQKFIQFAAQTNEIFAAIARDIGLLPDSKQVNVGVNVKTDKQQLENQLPDGPVGTVEVTPEITWPDTVDVPTQINVDISPATASFQQLVDVAVEKMTAIVTIAPQFGEATAGKWAEALAKGLKDAGPVVARATGRAASEGFRPGIDTAASYGEAAGKAFDYGIARGILSATGTGAIVAAARYVALLAYTSALSALQIRSPSRRGQFIGQQFVEGIVAGIQQTATLVSRAVRDLSAQTESAFNPQARLGFTAPLPVSPVGAAALTPKQTTINLSLKVENTISGAADPQEAAQVITDAVWQKLSGSINRLILQIDGAA